MSVAESHPPLDDSVADTLSAASRSLLTALEVTETEHVFNPTSSGPELLVRFSGFAAENVEQAFAKAGVHVHPGARFPAKLGAPATIHIFSGTFLGAVLLVRCEPGAAHTWRVQVQFMDGRGQGGGEPQVVFRLVDEALGVGSKDDSADMIGAYLAYRFQRAKGPFRKKLLSVLTAVVHEQVSE
jgi:hypothetical protein